MMTTAKTSGQAVWTKVDRYFGDLLVPVDGALDAALKANEHEGLPQIDVTPLQGRFLEFLVRATGARRVLEIGTLGGYSTIWMARALPEDGRVVTLELDPHHARVAKQNLKAARVAQRVEIVLGPATDTLPKLASTAAGQGGPFDLIFIDADKQGYPEYLKWVLKLSRPGTVIVADNVVREGKVLDEKTKDPVIQGVRRFAEMVAAEPRLIATVLQTVGVKGYDGFVLAVVLS
jgi:predicted O-methyltransferase YrrM